MGFLTQGYTIKPIFAAQFGKALVYKMLIGQPRPQSIDILEVSKSTQSREALHSTDFGMFRVRTSGYIKLICDDPSANIVCSYPLIFGVVKVPSDSLQCAVSIVTSLPGDSLVSPTILTLLYCLICLLSILSEIVDLWTFAQ